MKVLVTGATGFLGYHVLKRFLKEGYIVTAIGRKNEEKLNGLGAEFKRIDITESLEELDKDYDVIIHYAALSKPSGRYEDFYKANVTGTKNIIAFAKENRNLKRFIHISTPSIYTGSQERINISESTPITKKFLNHYAKTKYLGEKEVELSSLPYIILRPRAIFGEYDTSIVPSLVNAAKKGFLPMINNGRCLVDVTYVENVVQSIHLAVNSKDEYIGECYNVNNDEALELREVLKMLFEALKISPKYIKLPYRIMFEAGRVIEWVSEKLNVDSTINRYTVTVLSKSQTLDISKIKEQLNYKPLFTIKEGLNKYAAWYLKEEK
ncbi:NAD(P)-dependent oxidoreductase [Clostridium sp.]|uniref:NAD-dependent epimerase/dehydratase family protein n=1 Tax=Clostridium sp. TaxID=1506 RepID=UPI001DFC7E95|nr:NAD-dependent epimerase/dehydratase family protein [Clostridium sp.]MBS5939001.1 NAD-dependent epimerase/dehydratase family protein [Clostridium sp.]